MDAGPPLPAPLWDGRQMGACLGSLGGGARTPKGQNTGPAASAGRALRGLTRAGGGATAGGFHDHC